MSETCATVKIAASHPSQGEYVEINEADFDAAVHTLYGDSAERPQDPGGPVEIPEGWADLHHATRTKLAKAIGAEPANVSEADAAIEAEVAKRAAEAAPAE